MRAACTVGMVVLATLAGCAGADDSGVRSTRSAGGKGSGAPGTLGFAPDWAELALPFEPGHDHLDVHDHVGLSTPNFEIVGYNPLITDYYGTTAGDYFCGDVRERDGRTLAVVESWGKRHRVRPHRRHRSGGAEKDRRTGDGEHAGLRRRHDTGPAVRPPLDLAV